MMAVDLPNRDQLQLQSQFFTEEEEEEENISIIKPITKTYSSCFSSSGFGSIFSSPVESEQGSTESSESGEDDDDYIAELTLKMAHFMFQDEDNNRNEKEEEEGLDAEEWPKLGIKGKIENLHKNDENNTDVDGGCLSEKTPNPNLDFQSKKALIDEQIRTIQLNKVKQEQYMKQQQQMELNRQFYLQQHRKGSEMRAVFLGQSGSKAGSNGTGVFLPRGTTNNNPIDSRKKTGCSTVLIPARVVQALKLQYERMGIESRYVTGATFVNKNDGMILENLKYGQQQQQQQSEKKSMPAAMNNKEIIGLPQEWTY